MREILTSDQVAEMDEENIRDLIEALENASSWLAREYNDHSPKIVEYRALIARVRARLP